MTDKKITQLTALTGANAVAGDQLAIVDVSDTTMSASGTTKKIALSELQAAPLSAGTANGVAYLNGSKVLTTGSALTFDGSNLGLGVTPSAWGSNYRAIAVSNGGGDVFGVVGNGTTGIGFNFYNNNTNDIYKFSASAAKFQVSNSGQFQWFTAPSGTAGNAISFTQAMTLDASGNLLVGGTTAYNTTVNRANFTLEGPSSAILNFGIANANSGYIFSSASGLEINAAGERVISFVNNGAERARIDSSGNLLVGLTSATGVAKLQVSGPIRTTGYTVATLPAGTVGMRTYVTDALAPSFGVTVAGSGAVTIPVFYNGANWIVA